MAFVGEPRYGEWRTDPAHRPQFLVLLRALFLFQPRQTVTTITETVGDGGKTSTSNRKPYYGGTTATGAAYGTYGSTVRTDSRYRNSDFAKKGGLRAQAPSVRGAGPARRGGGPGGRGK